MKSSILLKKVLVITFIGILFASAFIYLTPMGRNIRTVLAEIISTTRYQQWGNLGCADYIGGKTMLEGKTPTIVTPESNIRISFDYKPAPSQFNVQQFKNDKTVEVPLKDSSYFNAPTEKGLYYYGISADWTTDDGKYSKGQTSSVFAIEVK